MAVAIFVFLQPEVSESVEVVDDLLQVWLCLVFMQETTSFIYLFLLISRSISIMCSIINSFHQEYVFSVFKNAFLE